MNRKSLIRELAKHAMAKKGAQQDSFWIDCDVLVFGAGHVPPRFGPPCAATAQGRVESARVVGRQRCAPPYPGHSRRFG
jgi:hypothetical protein